MNIFTLRNTIVATLLVSFTAFAQESASVDSTSAPAPDAKAFRLLSSPSALPGAHMISITPQIHTFLGLAFTLGASLRLTHSFSEYVHVGLGSNAGVLLIPSVDTHPLFYGAGPVVSIGKEKFFLNLSTLYYGLAAEGDTVGVFLPSVGISAQVKDTIRLQAEVVFPMARKEFEKIQTGVLLYGARFGKKVYVDVSFIAPLDGDLADVYKYFVLGIPIISVGAGF